MFKFFDNWKCIKKFEHLLELNDYPPNFPERKLQYKRRLNQKHKRFFYFQCPFISDDINLKIRNVFDNLSLPVRLSHRSFSLRMALNPNKNGTCNLSSCNNPDKSICQKEMIVYKIACSECTQIYVGSTARKLHTRINEHLKQKQSSVFKHIKICQPTSWPPKISVEILSQDNDIMNLRLRESMIIQESSSFFLMTVLEKAVISAKICKFVNLWSITSTTLTAVWLILLSY